MTLSAHPRTTAAFAAIISTFLTLILSAGPAFQSAAPYLA